MIRRRIVAPILILSAAALLSACSPEKDPEWVCYREGDALRVDRATCASIEGYWGARRGGISIEPKPLASPPIPVEVEPL